MGEPEASDYRALSFILIMLGLLNQILLRIDTGERLAVCALVKTRGSTPQKAGAIMVVLANGQTLGTIGGGCVEAEVRTRALAQLNIGGSQLLSFNLDHDHGWDDGLVCGGTMTVTMQILNCDADAVAYRRARDQLIRQQATALSIDVQDETGDAHVFSLPMQPSPQLVIAGAGHVGAALAAMAALIDFSVTVIDDRPDYASAQRFPGAICKIGPVEDQLSKVQINEQTFVVIVTPGHRRDALALSAVVNSPAAYIGLIGSKRKIITIFQDLLAQNISADALARVHAPIGLDIGAVTPAEIAVSIAAEIISRRRGITVRPITAMRLSAEQFKAITGSHS
jgi:xanthine dehydrogenase accessory factor